MSRERDRVEHLPLRPALGVIPRLRGLTDDRGERKVGDLEYLECGPERIVASLPYTRERPGGGPASRACAGRLDRLPELVSRRRPLTPAAEDELVGVRQHLFRPTVGLFQNFHYDPLSAVILCSAEPPRNGISRGNRGLGQVSGPPCQGGWISRSGNSGPGICSVRNLLRLTDLVDNHVPIVAVNDALEVRVLVPGLHDEVVGKASNPFVFLARQSDRLETGLLSTLAQEFNGSRTGDFRDAFIHLAEERFIPDDPLFATIDTPVVPAWPRHGRSW